MTERPSALNRFEKPALVVGIVGLVLSAIGGFLQPPHFFQAYLVAYIFWASIALGSIALLAIQYLTGGVWGVLIRRPLESAAKTLPLLLIGFVPIFLGMRHLYSWSRHDVMEHDVLLQKKAAYLNVPFFSARTIVFFILWIAIGYLLTKWDREYEDTGNPRLILRIRKVSAAALLIMTLTLTFASVDWMMSLEPHWYSTMYGISFVVGTLLSAMTFAIMVTVRLADEKPMAEVVAPTHLRDLGNLTFAFTMLWAYTAFSQFLLIWYGNLKEETPWYLVRSHGGWGVIAVLLMVFHFFVPFLLLLMRDVKDRAKTLGTVAAILLAMRLVDYFWLITPAFHREVFFIHWLHVATVVGIGGVWLYLFLVRLREESPLPMYEEVVREALTHG